MKDNYKEDLKEIRHLMNRSSRFTHVSGISGIAVGILALAATFIAYIFFAEVLFYTESPTKGATSNYTWQLATLGAITLILAILIVVILTYRETTRKKLRFWALPTHLLLFHLSVPLAIGGAVSIFLLQQNLPVWLLPTTLLFYGLALLSASHYTLPAFKNLGLWQLGLGLLALFFIEWALVFWAFGFGIIHILYGILILRKSNK
ncbi:MAG: hypothetical protein CMC08_06765 [Flavobacteriaceae bacterium]|nr:hypothetical protein [Flavobacteriaceae bacterium]